MARKTLTTANSKILLNAPVFPAPVELKQYSTDDIINQDDIEFAESRMGIDGIMSSGYVINSRVVNMTFESTSPSIDTFNLWINAMKTARDVLIAPAMRVSVPSLNATYVFTNGVIKSGKEMPDLKKTSQPITYTLEFESCTAVPL